jgi:hypothetical protein
VYQRDPALQIYESFSLLLVCIFQRKTKGKKYYVLLCCFATLRLKTGCSERSEQERYSLRFIPFRSFSSS